jgi:hypothetical protein
VQTLCSLRRYPVHNAHRHYIGSSQEWRFHRSNSLMRKSLFQVNSPNLPYRITTKLAMSPTTIQRCSTLLHSQCAPYSEHNGRFQLYGTLYKSLLMRNHYTRNYKPILGDKERDAILGWLPSRCDKTTRSFFEESKRFARGVVS